MKDLNKILVRNIHSLYHHLCSFDHQLFFPIHSNRLDQTIFTRISILSNQLSMFNNAIVDYNHSIN